MIILDIETLADSTESILARLPEFDEEAARESVPKNYKAESAINGWIEDHRANWGKDIVSRAALNPLYSTIALLTWWTKDEGVQQYQNYCSERDVIDTALAHLSHLEEGSPLMPARDYLNGGRVCGWGLKHFDLPYLCKRALILGIPIPKSVFNPFSRYPWSDRFIDLSETWTMGDHALKYTKLDHALRALGLPPKTHDGSEFDKLWATDREKACAYSRAEMESTVKLAERLGVL